MRRSPPHPPIEQVHRDEHRLEEHEEQQQVERHERAEHGGLEHQHRAPCTAGRSSPPSTTPAPQREQERGQQHHPQADAVDARPGTAGPMLFTQWPLHHLEPGVAAVEPAQHRERDDERGERGEQRDPPGRVVGRRRPPQQQRRPPTSGRRIVTIEAGAPLTAGTPRRPGCPPRPRGTPARTCARARSAAAARCAPAAATRRRSRSRRRR